MEREIKTVTTPVGKVAIVLKTWLSGKEKRDIQSVFLNNLSIKSGSANPNYEVKGELINQAQDKTIQSVVVSVGGKTENVLNEVLNLRSEDFEFVIDEINKVTSPISNEELKK